MSVRAFTPEQQQPIARRDGPLLLSANAGSGKTSVLVERIALLALEDGVAPSRVLAITFTEKAAGELRSRVRARFAAAGRRDLVAEAEAAWISTIHGFCARVLRAHAIAAGLDPGFAILDERRARALRETAFERALAGFLNGEDDAHRAAALDVTAAYRPDALAVLVGNLHDELRSRGVTAPRLAVPPAPPAPDAGPLREAAAAALAYLGRAGGGKRVAAALERCEELAELLAATPPGAEPLLAGLAEPFRTSGAKALAEAPCVSLLEELAAYRDAWTGRRATATLTLIGELLEGFAAEYAAAKRDEAALDFDDLELLTRDLLSARPQVAAAYAERFQRVMVDEFQDTNPLQLELLRLVAPGGAFVVGDERQSIYGFRHADVAVFRAEQERHAAHGAAASLATNFRSAPEILSTLDALFAPVFGPAWEPLRAGRPASPPGPARVELLVTTRADEGWEPDRGTLPVAPPWRHAEARLVAARVAELIGSGRFAARDVVVLLRAATDMAVYERAIGDHGISTLAAGGRGYWSRRQVLDLCAYAAALANPRDEQALFSVLASPLCGLSSDGLAHVAAAAPRGRRWEALADGLPQGLSAADAERLAGFREFFARERAAAPRRGLDEVLERAVTGRDYDLHVLGLPGGHRRLANVLKLQRLAAQVEAQVGRDVRAFIDVATAELEADAREADAPVDLGDADAVRLMTIHAAKGLEFPCVVVADLGRDQSRSLPDVTVAPDGRVGLRLRTLDGVKEDALDHAALRDELQERELREDERIFYVAMTRAEEHLVLSGAVDPERWPAHEPGRPPIGWIAAGLVPDVVARLADPGTVEHDVRWSDGEHAAHVRLVRNAPGDHDLSPPAPAGPEQLQLHMPGADGGPDVLAPLPAPPTGGVATLSYSSLAAYGRCAYRWYLERVLRLPADEEDAALVASRRAAAAEARDAVATPGYDARLRGSIVHTLLEDLDPRRPVVPDAEEIRALGAANEVDLTDADVADVVRLVRAFVDSRLRERLAAAPWLRAEHHFTFPLGPGEPLVNGVVDVVAREADGTYLIVDYKTDEIDPETDLGPVVDALYGIQRRIYALACLRAGAHAVEVAHLYLARPDQPVVARFTAADAGTLAGELRELARDLLDGRFAPTDAPHAGLCLTCPGRRALCLHGPARTLAEAPSAVA